MKYRSLIIPLTLAISACTSTTSITEQEKAELLAKADQLRYGDTFVE